MSDPASLPTAPLEVPRDPMVGWVIGERYRILARIGEGGMGAVYRAEHVLIKRVVAIKLLHAELGNVDDAARRFEREAQSASRLNHPNIISVTDFGRAAHGELFLVMEFVPGESLAARLERERRLSVREAVEITRQILLGLEHAHAQGVVHRDLKPANVMLTRPAGTRQPAGVKILDFGIAKMSQADPGERPLTQGAMVFGTPSYMSPEQATAQDADARSDVYSCGVMLYEMLTGRKPFVSDDLVKVMAMQVTQPPPPFAQVARDLDLPGALEDVVMRALEKDRARRFPSADAFREALEGARLDGGSVGALVQSLPGAAARARTELASRWARLPWKVRRFSPAAGVLGVVLALTFVPMICSSREGPAPTAAPPKPRPLEPAMKQAVRKIEEAIAAGRLTEARLLITQQISAHPESGRVRYLLGNLEFAEKNFEAGLVAYADALEREAGLRGDAGLMVNLRNLLPDKRLGPKALDLLIRRVGRPAGATLAEVATEDKRAEFRAAARDACQELGCADQVDLVRSHSLDLDSKRSCDDRREAVQRLAATGDKRAIEPLKRALRAGGGPFGLFSANTCIRKELQAAIKELEGR